MRICVVYTRDMEATAVSGIKVLYRWRSLAGLIRMLALPLRCHGSVRVDLYFGLTRGMIRQ